MNKIFLAVIFSAIISLIYFSTINPVFDSYEENTHTSISHKSANAHSTKITSDVIHSEAFSNHAEKSSNSNASIAVNNLTGEIQQLDYRQLDKKYLSQLPDLISSERLGNFMPLKPVIDLWSKANAGDLAAKAEYEKQLEHLKVNADAGDVRAQMDYAMFRALDSHSSLHGKDVELRLAQANEAKEYYLKAAIAGQAQAAKSISAEVVRKPIADTVESLAWVFISQKLGENLNAKYICERSYTPCTEETFMKAAEKAKLTISFYKFNTN